MNVILCGMMGCGKSTVGVILAKKINCKCVDTDVLIEERYGAIAELFERCGEEYFRGLETEILKELLAEPFVFRPPIILDALTRSRILFSRTELG